MSKTYNYAEQLFIERTFTKFLIVMSHPKTTCALPAVTMKEKETINKIFDAFHLHHDRVIELVTFLLDLEREKQIDYFIHHENDRFYSTPVIHILNGSWTKAEMYIINYLINSFITWEVSYRPLRHLIGFEKEFKYPTKLK